MAFGKCLLSCDSLPPRRSTRLCTNPLRILVAETKFSRWKSSLEVLITFSQKYFLKSEEVATILDDMSSPGARGDEFSLFRSEPENCFDICCDSDDCCFDGCCSGVIRL